MGEIVSPSVPSPEEDKNPFYLGKQCPYVGASTLQPTQAQHCASRQSPHRALGPQPVAPSPGGDPRWLPRRAGERRDSHHPREHGRAYGYASPARPAQTAFCGQRCSCWRQCLPPPWLPPQQRAGESRGINNSHTEKVGECRVLGPAAPPRAGPGRCERQGGRAGAGCLKSQLFSSLSQCGFGL